MTELDRAIATAAVSQTAEIEALTSAELTRLASSLKQQSEAALLPSSIFRRSCCGP